jgi:uncharacterized membrane protein
MNKFEVIGIALVFVSFVVGAVAYPSMPDRMVTHWDAQGVANGSMDKVWGVFLLPVIIALMEGLFLVIPRIDPLKANIAKFRKEFGWFVVGIMVFMLAVYKLTLLWNLGILINPAQTLPILIAFLFYLVGVLCEKSKRNWFIGMRTPWTMSSDRIWEKTNRLTGRMFKWAALISAIGIFAGGYAIAFILIPALAISAYAFIYSYMEFQNEKRGRKKAAKRRKR